MHRNPTRGQVKKREDYAMWLAADKAERKQHLEGDKPTFRHIAAGRAGVPGVVKVLLLKRVCTIKDTGQYKVRWVVLGNLDSFTGETYAPTTSKKTLWLLYAVSIILGLTR